MAAIKTGIELQDNFTDVMYGIIESVNMGVSAMNEMQGVVNRSIDTSAYEDVQDEINSTLYALNNLQGAVANVNSPTISANVETNTEGIHIDVSENIEVPVTPVVTEQPVLDVPENLEIGVQANGSSVDELNARIEQTQELLSRVSNIQEMINTNSQKVEVLPEETGQRISAVRTSIEQMQQALNMIQENPFNFNSEAVEMQIVSLNNRLRETLQDQLQINDALSHMNVEVENPPPVEVPVEIPQPDPVTVPVEWQTDNMEVFTNTGVDRFRQEIASANSMLEQLGSTQDEIARQAWNTNIIPPQAAQNLNSLAVRIDMIRDRINQISSNPMNVGTDEANAGLEELRSQLATALEAQNELNAAVQNMDVEGANAAYLNLSRTVANTERYIRDNIDEQGQFNSIIEEGNEIADRLTKTIMGAVGAYLSIQGISKALDISDELTTTTARIDMMNDGLQSTQELTNMIYAAAQDARGSFDGMADVVARFGNNAKDAFSSSQEVVAFADLVQKQMTIAGASTTEASNAMLQLSQALGSGVLRGDELNSIFEQAPNLIQSIADYLDVPIGQIREMASEGELSADIVKAAIFSSADEINAKFASMPMTWGQIWQSMQNTALIAFQPVLQRLNDLANSPAFQTFVDNAVQAMAVLAGVLIDIFDMVMQVGQLVADNWSWISPIVYGVIAALAVYAAYLGIVKTAELAELAVKGALAVAEFIHVAALAAQTGATISATAAQMGLNGAMYACPIVWIIMLIIALIAIIYAVASAIAKMTGIANSGFGVITGGINVVIQFFKNLGLEVANIALGIGNAIAALGSNMMTAFHNAISSIQAWFYDLLATGLTVIEGICEALNKLPFVEFDYSGIASAADDYAAKASEAANNKAKYQSISDAFNEGFSTFDTFQSGWISDAFNSGAAWGDGVAEGISEALDGFMDGLAVDIPNPDDYTSGFASTIADSLGNIESDTGNISDSLDITSEDLKYLRDIAEQETINRFTTAEINIEQNNTNNINNGMDLDGVVDGLTDAVNEAVDIMTEGVHE